MPVRSELTYLLVSLDKDYTASRPGEPWETTPSGSSITSALLPDAEFAAQAPLESSWTRRVAAMIVLKATGSALGRDVADVGDVAFDAGGLDGGEASLSEHFPRLLLAPHSAQANQPRSKIKHLAGTSHRGSPTSVSARERSRLRGTGRANWPASGTRPPPTAIATIRTAGSRPVSEDPHGTCPRHGGHGRGGLAWRKDRRRGPRWPGNDARTPMQRHAGRECPQLPLQTR
jgi:hypothetical protein